MPAFDYITSKDFRESLEKDYAEMERCAQVQSWKSVQVLAGSIVESVLIDYLTSSTNDKRPTKDPLKLDLAEAISICKSEKVLSDRTSDLCSVIRSYRNLIHPGRMVRMSESPPDKGSATVAIALVEMITEELAKILRSKVGLSAEQILSKIQRDANSLTILHHLLAEVSDVQKERLLLDLIPEALQENAASEFVSDSVSQQLAKAYRIILMTASPQLRTTAASRFIQILREADGEQVLSYGKAFFRAPDLGFLPEQNRPMVIEHLLSGLGRPLSEDALVQVRGIAKYLEPSQVDKWLDPFLNTIIFPAAKAHVKERAREHLLGEVVVTSTKVDEAISQRLKEWIQHFEGSQNPTNAALIKKLKEEMEAATLPF